MAINSKLAERLLIQIDRMAEMDGDLDEALFSYHLGVISGLVVDLLPQEDQIKIFELNEKGPYAIADKLKPILDQVRTRIGELGIEKS